MTISIFRSSTDSNSNRKDISEVIVQKKSASTEPVLGFFAMLQREQSKPREGNDSFGTTITAAMEECSESSLSEEDLWDEQDEMRESDNTDALLASLPDDFSAGDSGTVDSLHVSRVIRRNQAGPASPRNISRQSSRSPPLHSSIRELFEPDEYVMDRLQMSFPSLEI